MIVMATSCCRRDMAMLLETLRAREGSDLEIKVVILSRMIQDWHDEVGQL